MPINKCTFVLPQVIIQQLEIYSMEEAQKLGALKGLALDKLEVIVIPGAVEKNTFSYAELHEHKDEEQKFLIPELIPSDAVCGLIGEDGIGKTQLCIQLCLHIAMKRRKFLDLELNAIHNRCLIVATEDSRQKFTKAIVKQAYALNPNHNPKEVLIDFTEGGNFDEMKQLQTEMIKCLKSNPYDLVIVDALSDLFTLIDGEINSNSDARKILSMFQQLCNVYHTTIIFIHHAAKTKVVAKRKEGKLFLEKDDSQGAGAITQKPRTILSLSHDKKSIIDEGQIYTNYLHVVKANLMTKKYLTQALQLQYDTSVLLHTFMGTVDIELLDTESSSAMIDTGAASVRKPMPDEITLEMHEAYVAAAFEGVNFLSRVDIVKKLKVLYNVGENKLQQKGGYLEFLLENGIVEKSLQGIFKLPYIAPTQGSLLDEPPF